MSFAVGLWAALPASRRAEVTELLRAMAEDARTGSENDAHDAVAEDLHTAASVLEQASELDKLRGWVLRLRAAGNQLLATAEVLEDASIGVDPVPRAIQKSEKVGMLRAVIAEVLRSDGGWLSRRDVTQRAHVSRDYVRFHLDRLVAAGRAETELRPRKAPQGAVGQGRRFYRWIAEADDAEAEAAE